MTPTECGDELGNLCSIEKGMNQETPYLQYVMNNIYIIY
jgi:hypothetical protein